MSAQQASRRTGAVGVHSVNRVVYSVPELDEAQRFYTAFGLDNRHEGDRLDLYTFGHSHRWASIHANGGSAKRLEYVSFGVFEEDLPARRERVERSDTGCRPHPVPDGTGVWMRDAGYTRGWSVGRRVLGSNYFYYVRDPRFSHAEFSCDIDFVPQDIG